MSPPGSAVPNIRVQAEPFDLGAEMAALQERAGTGAGGIGCFVGVVRADSGSGSAAPLAALFLEHYPGMTEHALSDIVSDGIRRFGLLACTVVHRVGRLPVGEPIVLVLTAAPHRAAALDATAFLIDWLKTRAPFWKRQEFADGTGAWIEARDADDRAAARWDATRDAPERRWN
ncbi:MAG: molybdenum cofactor biosynthesis protein MoaE [Gluconacetobacter diazotrophicus]|nr:molybdenum cofactor biosynthesis protein MoaE [Gluconacetobacter diazotrophicus]